jgi:hypothetical protein
MEDIAAVSQVPSADEEEEEEDDIRIQTYKVWACPFGWFQQVLKAHEHLYAESFRGKWTLGWSTAYQRHQE